MRQVDDPTLHEKVLGSLPKYAHKRTQDRAIWLRAITELLNKPTYVPIISPYLVLLFSKLNKIFLGCFDPGNAVVDNANKEWGDLTDISCNTEALTVSSAECCAQRFFL